MGSGPSKYNLGDKAVNGESRKSTQDMGKNAPDLYFHETAPPCRAVIMAALGGGVRLNYRKIDIMRGEQKTKEFQRMNPKMTVPTLNDNGFCLWESRAIMVYLLEKYGRNESLYPSCPTQRAEIQKWLNYDLGDFFPPLNDFVAPQLLQRQPPCPAKEKKARAALDDFNKILEDRPTFITGHNATLADISLWCTLSIMHMVYYDLSPWRRILDWEKRMKKLPYFDQVNKPFYDWLESRRKSAGQQTISPPPATKLPNLYIWNTAPPCRAVMMVAKAAGIDLNYKSVNIFKGEQKTPEYLKLNPTHTVPTLDDNGVVLWESRAIMPYLLDKYGNDDSLYPRNPEKRAEINKLLNFDLGSFFTPINAFVAPQLILKQPPNPEKEKAAKAALDAFEGLLNGKDAFLTGDEATIADISLWCSMSTLYMVFYDISPWKNIVAWEKRIERLSYFHEINKPYYDFLAGRKEAAKKAEQEAKANTKLPDLYLFETAPPCRAVMMVAKAAGIELNYKSVNIFKGEQKTPEYLKMNPDHTVPTLDDNGFIVWESRAIMTYLLEKYKKNTNLWPDCPNTRATIQRLLNFDAASFFVPINAFVFPQLALKQPPCPEKENKAAEALTKLDAILEDKKTFIVGDDVTIADLSLWSSLSTLYMVLYDISPWKNIVAWEKRIKQLPYFDAVNKPYYDFVATRREAAAKAEQEAKANAIAKPPLLYMFETAPPCRAVMMMAKAASIKLNYKSINILKGEQNDPEYLKLNPEHTVPTLDDNGFVVWESRAIMPYLMDKYAQDDSLYPKCPQTRAEIQRWLAFDLGSFFTPLNSFVAPQFIKKAPPCPEMEKKAKEALDKFNEFMEGKSAFVTGDKVTIADLSLWCSLSVMNMVYYDLSPWTNIANWENRVKRLPYFNEINKPFFDMLEARRNATKM